MVEKYMSEKEIYEFLNNKEITFEEKEFMLWRELDKAVDSLHEVLR